jgi:chemotaxis-related protein WspB
VIDLGELAMGRPSERRLSTRIILVDYTAADGAKHLLGLIAEKATETLRREPGDFAPSGVTSDAAAYLGPVTVDARGLVQWIEVKKLLPASVQEALFKQPVESA